MIQEYGGVIFTQLSGTSWLKGRLIKVLYCIISNAKSKIVYNTHYALTTATYFCRVSSVFKIKTPLSSNINFFCHLIPLGVKQLLIHFTAPNFPLPSKLKLPISVSKANVCLANGLKELFTLQKQRLLIIKIYNLEIISSKCTLWSSPQLLDRTVKFLKKARQVDFMMITISSRTFFF